MTVEELKSIRKLLHKAQNYCFTSKDSLRDDTNREIYNMIFNLDGKIFMMMSKIKNKENMK